MAIKMLKKYKDKFKINKINLKDNAKVQPINEKYYNLSQFKLLTEGITWYEKFGFKINKDIIKNLKTKETNLYKLIKDNNKIDSEYKNNILKYIKLNKENYLLELINMIFVENRHNHK